MPDEPEAHGLLALMMIHHARRRARFSGEDLVLLDDQDRSLWDMRPDRGGPGGARPGDRRWVGAAPTSCRPRSRRCRRGSGSTGRRSPSCTGGWSTLTGSPVVELNRAVALAQAGDLAAALRAVDRLDLDGYLYFHSTRGELLRRLGRDDEARAAYRRALELATSTPERRFLTRRLEQL